MCGRFHVSEDESIPMLHEILEYLEQRTIKVKKGEVFPGDVAAVVACNKRLEPRPFAMEWGYHLPNGKRLINARSETAAEKAIFADGIRQRRCLIPANHYFEWEKKTDSKIKYAIEPKHSEEFFLAGIYRIEGGKPVFVILTRDAADGIAFIHNRMPVMIPREAALDWLNPNNHGNDILKTALVDMEYTTC